MNAPFRVVQARVLLDPAQAQHAAQIEA
ncbi:MAG: hypothetical protein RL671_444, partial [Pseudomonadota bacterium]